MLHSTSTDAPHQPYVYAHTVLLYGCVNHNCVLQVEPMLAACEPGFLLYSGDDAGACEFVLKGGHGVISVTADVAPALMAKVSYYCCALHTHTLLVVHGFIYTTRSSGYALLTANVTGTFLCTVAVHWCK